jgi:hypothetical protein
MIVNEDGISHHAGYVFLSTSAGKNQYKGAIIYFVAPPGSRQRLA